MTRTLSFSPLTLVILICLSLLPGIAQGNDHLRQRLEASLAGYPLMAGTRELHSGEALHANYRESLFQLLWWQNEDLSPEAQALVAMIEMAMEQGLQGEDYHYQALKAGVSGADAGLTEAARADLDLMLSDAFILLYAHLGSGKVNPVTIDPEWFGERHRAELDPPLLQALSQGTVAGTLQAQKPDHEDFRHLIKARQRLLTLSDRPWQALPQGPLLRPGGKDPRVPQLRERLRLLGDLTAPESPDADPEQALHYDDTLVEALRRFQSRHGLEPDGLLGPASLAALNTTPQERLQQLDVNLERWRWLPRSLGERYVLVNIAGFQMRYVEQGETVLEQRVIVGRDYRRTPVFSDRIRYLEFNPTWTVPPTLAVRDQLPQIRKDPQYLRRMNFVVYDGWGANRSTVDPDSVDWQNVSARRFPYRLVQQPGPLNALGQVKFMFPNRFNVYLHDTPARDLFQRADRAFSSGCVRVDQPLKLAELLLQRDAGWTQQRINETLASSGPRVVNLRQPVPVHIQYWTTWAESDGTLQWRRDIYQRDRPLAVALNTVSL